MFENIKLICHDQVLVQLILNSLGVNGIHNTSHTAQSTLDMANLVSLRNIYHQIKSKDDLKHIMKPRGKEFECHECV